MPRYHRSKDGKFRECKAQPGNCPLEHFDSLEAGLKHDENREGAKFFESGYLYTLSDLPHSIAYQIEKRLKDGEFPADDFRVVDFDERNTHEIVIAAPFEVVQAIEDEINDVLVARYGEEGRIQKQQKSNYWVCATCSNIIDSKEDAGTFISDLQKTVCDNCWSLLVPCTICGKPFLNKGQTEQVCPSCQKRQAK